jgi:hypothetical protein
MTMKAKNLAISIWLLATALGAAVAQSQPVEVTLLNANQTAPAAASNSPTRGQVKIPHLTGADE